MKVNQFVNLQRPLCNFESIKMTNELNGAWTWRLDSFFMNLVQDFASQLLQPKFVLMLARCLLLHKHDLYKQRRLAHMGVKNIAIVFFAASFSQMCRVSKPCALVLFWSPVTWPSSFEVVFFDASFSQLCKGLQTMRSCTVLIPCHVSDTCQWIR